MSIEKGREYFRQFGMEDRVQEFEVSSATVELAAQALGVEGARIAKTLAEVTGYTIKSTPNSAGGYKDWCIKTLKIPAFTIEVGSDKLAHPIRYNHLEEIYQKNKKVFYVLIRVIIWNDL